MNHAIRLAAAVVLAATAVATNAASPFNGTWKYDMKSVDVSKKPNAYLLTGGMYTCSTCVPSYSVAADGAYHAVGGNPYYDEVSVKVVDANTIAWSSRKGGKPMSTSTKTVAADGKTATVRFNDMTATNGVAVTGQQTDARVAAGPAGSHAISGSWVDTTDVQVDDAGVLVTLRMDGDALTMTTPTGIAYTAKIGGPRAPVTGDPGWTGVTLVRTTPATLIETDYRGEAKTGVFTYAMAADGRSIRLDANDLIHGTTSAATLKKQ